MISLSKRNILLDIYCIMNNLLYICNQYCKRTQIYNNKRIDNMILDIEMLKSFYDTYSCRVKAAKQVLSVR